MNNLCRPIDGRYDSLKWKNKLGHVKSRRDDKTETIPKWYNSRKQDGEYSAKRSNTESSWNPNGWT
jgi:hypothetical protein